MSLRRKFKSERAPLIDNNEVRLRKEKFGHQILKQPVETARTSQRNMSKVSGAYVREKKPTKSNLCAALTKMLRQGHS